MNIESLMALADAYAAAEQHDYLTVEASADHARAALEAALTEKQEPVNQQLLEALKTIAAFASRDGDLIASHLGGIARNAIAAAEGKV